VVRLVRAGIGRVVAVRILIVTAGSRGDVAPFTGLGQRLRQAGHQVALAAHETFAGLVRGSGLEYRPLPGDPQELVRARTVARSPEEARLHTIRFLEGLGEGIVTAADQAADVVLTALGPAPLSRLATEVLGLPMLGTYLAPAVPTGEFALPGLPQPGGVDRAANLAAGRAQLATADSLYAGILPRLRARLGLPIEPAAGGRAAGNRAAGNRAAGNRAAGNQAAGRLAAGGDEPGDAAWPVCHGFSPLVVPRPGDWPSNVEVSGYWWPARPGGWQPPGDLADFLAAGPPPVFIGFGSMAPDQGGRLSRVIADAVTRAGVRAVVQAGWAGLTGVGDHILAVGDLPHDWLFPQVAAVVHHAGAGTTGAGLRAGVPAVAVPVLADQPFWAHRLHGLGVAPEPVYFEKLTAETLGGALRECLGEPGYRERAVSLARQIADEDGAAAVLAWIERLAA
jgi:UDP:flavonoid glycosyltransferase YjiC (YdhE family)